MPANDWGARIWDEFDTLVFDTTDYSGRYVDSLTFNGPQPSAFNFNVPGKPAESDLWIKVEYYNVPMEAMASARVIIIPPATISMDLQYVAPGCVTVIHYGWR